MQVLYSVLNNNILPAYGVMVQSMAKGPGYIYIYIHTSELGLLLVAMYMYSSILSSFVTHIDVTLQDVWPTHQSHSRTSRTDLRAP